MSTYKSLLTVGMSMFGSLTLRTPEPIPVAPPIVVEAPAVMSSPIVRTQPRRPSEFMKAIAVAESRNNPNRVNSFGMLGKYQFSPSTIAALGFEVTPVEFLSNEALQDSVMRRNMRYNYNRLRELIQEHNGTYRDGVYVTTAGILAGAHLVGVGGVLAYFYPDRYNHPVSDGNGVHVREYIERFSEYSVQL